MPVRRLTASVRWADGIPVVDLRGDIDAPGEGVLNAAYKSALAQAAPAIVLNFCGAGFINSKGIALIVALLSQTRRSGQGLLAYGLTDHYRKIFEITQLSKYIDVYKDETSALAAATSTRRVPLGQLE